ncbi:hypothetical protein EEL53_10020 [Muribaculaceae bacterium Isolate-114 (HZI)]|nr:hypothetical protein EEL53_10020 [Muribaculaceae bacterium Isolate-114 (HZI)]
MEELKRYLNGLGACDLKDNVDSLESAIRMMFTPQGREFCVKTGFPTLEFLRKHKEELNAIPGVFIDDGRITPSFIPDNVTNILISGDTKAYLCVSKPTHLHKIIVAYNAKLCLSAEVFAVATITEIGEVHTEIANDGTAKVIIER